MLLAEDNPINQKLVVTLLQKAGFSVDTVESGLQAIEQGQRVKYNAILMDVQMPEMDGLDATRRIRQLEQGEDQHIPIIAMTAHALKGDRERCLEAGMDDYVSKPLDPPLLFKMIDRWIQTQQETQRSIDNLSSSDLESNLEAVQTASEETVLDLSTALPRFGNDRSFFLEMCQDFIEQIPTRLQEMKISFYAGDANRLSSHAHNLKGVAANFSAGPISRIAK